MASTSGSSSLELFFVCPSTGRGFSSASWQFAGEPWVEEGAGGARALKGMVDVLCPLCGQGHRVAIEEVACPFVRE